MDQPKSHFVNSSSGVDPHLPKQRSQRKRHPLSDATAWVNNQSIPPTSGIVAYEQSSPPPIPHHSSLHAGGILQNFNTPSSPVSNIEKKGISTVLSTELCASNVLSQISNHSTSASAKGRRKTHVGPWRLGRTIGKGASGRVRKARHAYTGQDAAIKIVSKKSAEVLRSQSLAFIDAVPQPGRRAIPFGIEREVVIMKMIEHPNIIRLYDIWENHGELYLVLEYVEGGELFNHISSKGSLPEYEAVRIFRQIIAALAYCHQFNICHRDLKPENILMDRNQNIKIVDFGMAALQPVNKWLETPCGSPHYASPEVIRSTPYRGDKADIWSCGVILFAMLAGFLPFDSHTEDWRDVISAVLECDYIIPESLSIEAQDLISRILQPDPKRRVSIKHMWDHPLIKKYAYLDSPDENGASHIGPPACFTTNDCGPHIKQLADIDRELLRNLHNLWYGVTEEELAQKLLSDEPNHEKIVYSKLLHHREEQLENYDGPTIENSISDYHHVNQPNMINHMSLARPSIKLSQTTQQSSQYSLADHHVQSLGRRGSQAVQRNASVAETERTAESYDPFRPSRSQMLAKAQADHMRITVLRQQSQASSQRTSLRGTSKTNLRSPTASERGDFYDLASSPPGTHTTGAPQLQKYLNNKRCIPKGTSKITLDSIRTGRSASSQFVARRPDSYKRNISFSHAGRRSSSGGQPRLRSRENQPTSKTLQERFIRDQAKAEPEIVLSSGSPALIRGSPMPDAQQTIRSKKNPAVQSGKSDASNSRPPTNWTDDVRKVSTELDKLCDTAFNRVSVSSSTPTAATPAAGNRESDALYPSSATSFSIYEDPTGEAKARDIKIRMKDLSPQGYQHRPLPPAPHSSLDPLGQDRLASYTHRELAKTRELLKKRNRASYMEPGYLDDVIAHLDRLMQPSSVRLADEARRAVTDPVANTIIADNDSFDKIMEQGNIGFRSASEPTGKSHKRKKTRSDKDTIRMVNEPFDSFKPVSPIKPLTIRKKSCTSTPNSDSSGQRTPTQPAYAPDDPRAVSRGSDHHSTGLALLDKALEPIVEGDDFDPADRPSKKPQQESNKKGSWFRTSRHQAKSSKDAAINSIAPLQPQQQPPPLPAKDPQQMVFDCGNIGQKQQQQARPKRTSATSATSDDIRAPSSLSSSEPKKTMGGGGKPGRFFKAIFASSKRDSKDSAKSIEKGNGGDYDLDEEDEDGDGGSVSTGSGRHHRGRLQALQQEYPALRLEGGSPRRRRGEGAGSGKSTRAAPSRQMLSPSSSALQLSANAATLQQQEQRQHHQARPLHHPRPFLHQPQHSNWFARFLGIKPATAVMCFQVSKVRAKREVVGVWREWRKYGMRDVVVERGGAEGVAGGVSGVGQRKRKGVRDGMGGGVWVRARVGRENSLNIPPLTLSAEIHTLLHRGRRANISIARFTQEKGAKSSFERVVQGLERVLRERGVLVEEPGVVAEMRRGAGM